MAVRINEKSRTLIVDGTEIEPCGLGYMYEYSDCKDISLPGLRRAIAKLEDKKIPPFVVETGRVEGEISVSEKQADFLLSGTTGRVTFCLRGGIRPDFITIDVNDSGDLVGSFFVPSETDDLSCLVEAFSPHLSFRGARLVRCKYWEDPGPKIPPGWDIDVLLPRKRESLSSVLELAVILVRSLTEAIVSMGPEFVVSLCHGGAANSLLGFEESDWLEVKSQGYDLDNMEDKIELAQDVSRFANSEAGGILAIGFRTKKNRNVERISKCTPIREKFARVARYRAAIDSRVYPPIDGLKVQATRYGEGWVVTVLVPPQAEENKPFLVHGAIAGGRVEGAFVSIVRRRGEASIPITGPAIHSMLSAGRSILRGRGTGE
ncbi:ATP-binding protein [Streptomyces solisilvae]|uniref:ATP-binding protein n=1 Tax=Streptomyces malaysiensis TaxID=92644 RepID=UPI0033223953